MAIPLLPLAAALLFLMIDSAIELALVSSMVGYLHRSGANQYPFIDTGTGNVALINAKPKHLLLNEGHTSNGAAGTALVLISFGGFLVLFLQHRRARNNSDPHRPSRLFLAYAVCTILSFLLTVAALGYTFSVTHSTSGQSINPIVAAQHQSHAYPDDQWTPENWTKALLALPLTDPKDVSYLHHWLGVMKGWKWNLIPLFFASLLVMVLSVHAAFKEFSRSDQRTKETYSSVEQSTPSY